MTKILLVDDSKFLRLATERALFRAGYDISTATDGEQALEMARERQPDLILLDMLLPKIPGPEVLKALKKGAETADIPVVVFTGLSHKNAARLQHDGAFGYLEKSELCLEKGCEALLSALADIVRQLPAKTSASQRGSAGPARSKAGVDKGEKDTSRAAFAFPQQERR